MAEQNSGGSESFSMPGLEDRGTADDSTTASVPQQAEDLPPQEEGKAVSQTSEKVEAKEQEPEAKTPQEPTINNEGSKAHTQVIELLQDKFEQLKEGKLTEEELKEWFGKHPDFADTANRSKRIKEDFRELMENQATEPKPEKVEAKSDEKPLTIKDLEKYDAEREERLIAKAQERERHNQLTEFAVKNKLVDDQVTMLERNAAALYKANPEWDYGTAVKAAYAVVNPQKGSPVNVAGSSLKSPESYESKFDATRGGELISASKFSGGQIKD